MRNIIRPILYSGSVLICLILIITCIKVEKIMMVSTGSVNNVQITSARVEGTVVDIGNGYFVHGHCWSTTKDVSIYGSSERTSFSSVAKPQSYSSDLTNLKPGTTYYIKAYMTGEGGEKYGREISFRTNEIVVPTLTTAALSAVTTVTATSGGNITTDGGATITARGVCWSTTANPTVANNKTTNGSGTGSFVSNLTGLNEGTLYYVRAYATNSVGTGYGNELTFTTIAARLPIVSTDNIFDITTTSAFCSGTISNDGGASITQHGVCWNTATLPTILNFKTTEGSDTGYFESRLVNLTPGTTYFVRAYATNIKGTAYGNELSFTTIKSAPTITTSTATSITNTTATLNGTVNANNSSTTVTFEYGLTTSYGVTLTAANSPVIGTNVTSVSVVIAGLVSGQTYHYRIVAVSAVGTAYGLDGTFTTTMRDNDGNDYTAVTIGTQVWMKENLKTTKYNDGTSIPLVTDNTAWINLTTPGFCWYNNSESTYKTTYGALYNWYTVNTGKVCPKGWHVPSDAEYASLTSFLGGESVAGGKLKEAGITHWESPNTGASNSSGFTALPGGGRGSDDGTFWDIWHAGAWWSTKEYSITDAYFIDLYSGDSMIYIDFYHKQLGLSVRCIRD